MYFDTSTVPPHERLEFWQDATQRLLYPVVVENASAEPYAGRFVSHDLGHVTLTHLSGSPSLFERTRGNIAAGDPEAFIVALLLRGRHTKRQHGRSIVALAGDITCQTSSQPYAVRAEQPFEQILLSVPSALLGRDGDRICRDGATPLDGSSGMGAIVSGTLRQLATELLHERIGPERLSLGDSLLAMVRGLCTPRPAAVAAATPRDLLLSGIKAYIDAHLGDPDLRPEPIARAQFISPRYLYKLFEPEGVTVSHWIRARRLERCRLDLQDPRLATETISSIAARWGFGSAAHFTRAVKRAYGCTPRELRDPATAGRLKPDDL